MTALTNIGSYLVRRLIDLVPSPVRRAARSSTMHAAAVGLGGGGTLYAPIISPADPNVMVVACDMGGLYLSRDAGQHWTLLDHRRVAQPAVVTEGSELWQVRLGALADFDLYTPNLLYTIGPNRPLSSYDVTTGTWTTVPVTRDPDHPHLLNSSPSPAGPTVPRARLLFVTDVNAGGPGPYPRSAILVGLPGAGTNWPHDEAAATVKRDGTVTAVLERHGDGTTAPIEGRCMAVTACFDPALEWAVPLLATRTALYSATDRVDATTFRRVGGGLPPLDQHLSIFDLTCAWYGSRHLYLTLVSDNGNPEAGVYRTTDPQGNGWTRVEPDAASGLPAGVPFGPIAAAGPVRQAPGGNNVLSEKAAASVYVAAWTADKPYQRVYRSQDGGDTWSHVLNVGAASDNPGGA